ncbi:MAG: heat-inducible transcriptional repressor HrcA, partial [Kamptonema sp. SIO4C4]|nr:heat-inducible transcriptional repressor HrcA [Kamptonema sp. SIO4C4]
LNLYTQTLDWGTGSLETLLQRAAHILSSVSGHIALVTIPQNSKSRLYHLQLVPLTKQQVMLVMVTDSYYTQSVVLDFPEDQSLPEVDEESWQRELQILSNFLNQKLRGESLMTLHCLDWGELDREFNNYAEFLRSILQELKVRSHSYAPILIRGISEALRQPEFSQLQQVQMLMQLLEQEQEQLFPLIFELPDCPEDSKRVIVRIGTENSLEALNVCTLITANYCKGDIPLGSVGLLGPTRMLYENAIAMVEATADYLSETLST